MIIAIGYRIRSHRGTQFRQWVTERLSEYLDYAEDRAERNQPMYMKGWVDRLNVFDFTIKECTSNIQ